MFSFGAQEYEDGTATGQFQRTFGREREPPGFFLAADVTCVSVVDNEAWIGGVITRHSGGRVGGVWFRVVDQGESWPHGNDQISALEFGTPAEALAACAAKPDLAVIGITEGNIQVAAAG